MKSYKTYKLKKSSCDCDDCTYFGKQKDGFKIESEYTYFGKQKDGFDKEEDDNEPLRRYKLVSLDGKHKSSYWYVKSDLIEMRSVNLFDEGIDELFEI